MSTTVNWQTTSDTAEATELLAEKIGKQLRGGEVIELVSDLGGGKTTFVRGLVRGAGSSDRVASPSFTISKQYTTDAFEIHHFDFYRLQESGIMADEVAEVVDDPQTVVVIEWGDVVAHVLPAVRLIIRIAQTPTGNRIFSFEVPESLGYLLKEMK
ncbi:MAG TPA: tRNA (adenosine(37)-N6)-threonylcarbamoyltransferase complex ATPase subunit type 1 TsaE [Patescibacteria group bacterium]|nr:tRNA (adenosine(37)-N6)-threonylcarbamoyltransferase complex ATPase subunit type 1 TsaE [Patescibacteria group bacterium]